MLYSTKIEVSYFFEVTVHSITEFSLELELKTRTELKVRICNLCQNVLFLSLIN